MAKAADPTIRFLCARLTVPPAIRLGSGMGLDISPDGKVGGVHQRQAARARPSCCRPAPDNRFRWATASYSTHSGLNFLPDGKGVIMIAAEPGKSPRTYIQMLDGTPPKAFGPEDFRGSQTFLRMERV